jgi:hypothetical protein
VSLYFVLALPKIVVLIFLDGSDVLTCSTIELSLFGVRVDLLN